MPERKQLVSRGQGIVAEMPSASRIADPILKEKGEDSSLLGEFGLGAGILALGGLLSKAKFAPRLAAGKGILAMGMHGLRRTGAKLGHSATGGLAGAALLTPTAYLGNKAIEQGENDKKFDAGNFASIAAPAVANGLLGYGMFANISQSVSQADKTGYKGMVRNIFSPKRNIRYAKHGFKLAGKAFGKVDTSRVSKVKPGFNFSRLSRAKGLMGTQWKGRAGGLVALGLMGMEAIAPAMYLNKTLKNKKDDNNGRI